MAGSLLNLRNRKTIKKKKEMKSAHMRNPQLQILFSSGNEKSRFTRKSKVWKKGKLLISTFLVSETKETLAL